MAKRKPGTAQLKGDVFVLSERQESFSYAQVQLLQAIAACGSISSAAKHVGISYKTAWDRVDAINNLCEQAVVARTAGGAKGGGTTLTEYGEKMVAGFTALATEHDEFLQRIGSKVGSLGDIAHFMRGSIINSSARNQYRGKIKRVDLGAVNAEVELTLSDSQSIIAQVTLDSVEQMQLERGQEVIALIKSSWIILSKDVDAVTSARNKLVGTVDRVVKGAVNSEVILSLEQGKSICAVITNTSVEELKLQAGDQACALFKASSVILLAD